MFDSEKVHELENKSHIRGKLTKQFYHSEQEELERKRRQMKAILDQQVQQRKRQKQRQRYEQERKLRKQEEDIRNYYAHVEQRERKNHPANSRVQQSNNARGSYADQPLLNYPQPYRSPPGIYNSKVSHHDKNGQRNRTNSKKVLVDAGDIPVMPVMQGVQSPKNSERNQNYRGHHNQSLPPQSNFSNPQQYSSAGNIPLLELLPQEQQSHDHRIKKKSKSKRKQTLPEEEKERSKRKQSVPAEDEYHPGEKQNTQLREVFGDLNEELETENRELRQQLKKNQEAVSLLIGAVRSNAKMDKFRVQAQRILHGQQSTFDYKKKQGESGIKKPETRGGQKQKQKQLMLPKLKLKHQSIMHDYMLGSAKKGMEIKSKTFK